jgi:hypothetical protein
MHQDKFVTVFFIERVPQYAFRQCNSSLKKPPDDGNIIAEMRSGALFQ